MLHSKLVAVDACNCLQIELAKVQKTISIGFRFLHAKPNGIKVNWDKGPKPEETFCICIYFS